MKTPPKVSIVIPIYNVEPYLRQCLDSIVNQTLQDLQIICVNDGSTDGSRAILQEYADQDARIEIIDKPNGGLSSARNAAYPHIKGKYTQFVDSDDWIELDACRKVFLRAEQSQVDSVGFNHYMYHDATKKHWEEESKYTATCYETIEQKIDLLRAGCVSSCTKLWRSDFLFQNNIVFPVGLIHEDNAFFWHAVVKSRKISVLPEYLYYYRQRAGSIMQRYGKERLDMIHVTDYVYNMLQSAESFHHYENEFRKFKLNVLYGLTRIPLSVSQQVVIDKIRAAINDGDKEFLYHTTEISRRKRSFFLDLVQSPEMTWRVRGRMMKTYFLGPITNFFEKYIKMRFGGNPKRIIAAQKNEVVQLSDLVMQLCEEIVQLREENNQQAKTKRAT